MFTKFRSKFTYANVMATIAVFVALGGSSYAAITITGKNVKNSSLTGKDIKNSSLTTSDVKNRSLLARDFKSGQLVAGARGPAGTNGASGSAGTARAYGNVSGAGVLDPAVRKNATVTRKSDGIYCIVLDPSINASTTAASATLAFASGVDAKIRSIPKTSAGTCDVEPNAVAVRPHTATRAYQLTPTSRFLHRS